MKSGQTIVRRAVAGAVQMTLDLSTPFVGTVRLSGQPMRYALDVVNRE